MPWNPDGTRKRSSLYKKSSGFKMKSPLKHPHPKSERLGIKRDHTHPKTKGTELTKNGKFKATMTELKPLVEENILKIQPLGPKKLPV